MAKYLKLVTMVVALALGAVGGVYIAGSDVTVSDVLDAVCAGRVPAAEPAPADASAE